jgi:NAD(P)-dependent dehydrogenase (short-subunit alcohol dehydrogenase family)
MTSIVLITGASGGIGRALARLLHGQGLRVAAVARDAGRLSDVDAAVRIAADTTTPEGAALAVAACREALGAAPTLLAHCVGSTLIAPLHRTRAEAYREVMRVNLDSAVFVLQAWLAALQGARPARPCSPVRWWRASAWPTTRPSRRPRAASRRSCAARRPPTPRRACA